MCDPMHGNTFSVNNIKTRCVDHIKEVKIILFFNFKEIKEVKNILF